MALGSPAIGTPNRLDLRAIQTAISNIRQRIEQVESATSTAQSTATQASGASTGTLNALRSQLSALTNRVTALEASINLDEIVLVASVAVGQFVPVVPTGNGTCGPADANDPTAMFGVLGVSTGPAAVSGPVTIQRRGLMSIPSAVFEPGRAVYVGDLGITQFPSYESTAIPVGVAVGATLLWIAPDWPALSEVVFASGVGDEFLRYLPVTYAIVKDAVALLQSFNAQPNGILIKTGENTVESRVLVAGSGSGITIANADGVEGDPTFSAP